MEAGAAHPIPYAIRVPHVLGVEGAQRKTALLRPLARGGAGWGGHRDESGPAWGGLGWGRAEQRVLGGGTEEQMPQPLDSPLTPTPCRTPEGALA